ncbi:MAG: TIGR00730 family Rossman fold protein [Desulfovibrio sp.]
MKSSTQQYMLDSLSVQESWRMFRILAELVEGIEVMSDVGPAISIFGSARVKPEDPVYKQTEELAARLAEENFAVITGGGPGLMEAGNKGCFEAGGKSVGLNIRLPMEQHTNPYLKVENEFRYFFIRKLMFIKYAMGYVAMPGGYGTLDELSEALVLIQTKRIRPFPIVLMGTEFFGGLVEWFKDRMVKDGYCSEEDLDLFIVTDSIDEAVNHIKRHVIL